MNLWIIFVTGLVPITHTHGEVVNQGLTSEELAIFETFGVTVTNVSDAQWLLEHVGIPHHDTGDFPNQDNPNSIGEQHHDYDVPKSPTWLDTPGCLPMGIIAMAKSGVPFFNPYTAEGLNAIGNEAFDDCEGHPDPQSTYHYHQLPSCLYGGGNNELMGVALDGYAIYGPKDENGAELTTADLDFCHGRLYNGRYQYHITRDFPYVLSCYRGQATTGSPPGRKRRHIVEENSRLKRQNRPPPGGRPGGGASFEACYAYCENPSTNEETGCAEPVYDVGDDVTVTADASAPTPTPTPPPQAPGESREDTTPSSEQNDDPSAGGLCVYSAVLIVSSLFMTKLL